MQSRRPVKNRSILWAGLWMLVSGCIGPTVPRQNIAYYTLVYPPPLAVATTRTAVVLQIDPFTVAAPFDTEKIVYEPAPYRRDVYHYHRWESNPADLVSHFLARDLKASGRFAAVLTAPGSLSATHFLTGSLDEMYEYDSPKGWQAVLGITVTLSIAGSRAADQAILFQKSYRNSEWSANRNPQAVVAAMSAAMAAVSRAVYADISAAVSIPDPVARP